MSADLADTLDIVSPGRVTGVSFMLRNGAPYYRVTRFGREVIEPSRLGFILRNDPPLAWDFSIASSVVEKFEETWTQPWGERRRIKNAYTELSVLLQQRRAPRRRLRIFFRAFDDGAGLRYEIPEQDGLGKVEIMEELTEFALPGNHRAWWIPAYGRNRYEYLYRETRVSEIECVHTPVTFETAGGQYLSIHEAALTDFASMTLARTGVTVLSADLVPWSDGVKVSGSAPMKSPWRTIQIGDTPGDLLTSSLILNLNEPNKLQDISWIAPGKYVGVWWEMHIKKSTWHTGPRHGATTANAKRYVDFAARHGFDGVLVEGWNVGWNRNWIESGDRFDFLRPTPDFDLEEVARYAREKGVRLIGHHETCSAVENYERQMDQAFALYRDLGVRVVKTGYVGHGRAVRRTGPDGTVHREWHHGQYMVRHYRRVVETAARYGIMIDAHEPIKDTGIRRTWPNMMTREGMRGQEYNAWGKDGGNPPDHTTILPFTRMLAGPLDFTPGIFDVLFEDFQPNNRVNTTVAKQLALYVVLYSPLQMAADLPDNYEAMPEAFKFIEDVPVDWHDTIVLHGRIGDYLTIVRRDRGSDDWYLGSITDEEGRLLEAPLHFLDPGREYVAEIYRDGDGADWKDNPMEVVVEERPVEAGGVLPLRLAPGGGQAIRFRPI